MANNSISSDSRSSASPISQLPPFLLAAMSGGGGGSSAPGSNGPRLDALLRQVATNGPPSKKAKVRPIKSMIRGSGGTFAEAGGAHFGVAMARRRGHSGVIAAAAKEFSLSA